MTLSVTASEIQIKNAIGQVKFNSSNKLVYLKYEKTNSITVSNTTIYEPFYALNSDEFLLLTVNISSCTGNIASALVGKEIPANGSILLDFNVVRSGNSGLITSNYMCQTLIDTNLVFRAYYLDYNFRHSPATITTSLTYKAKIYSYL